MDSQLRELFREIQVTGFDIDLYRQYTYKLIRSGDPGAIFEWVQHLVPSSRLPNLPGLLLRISANHHKKAVSKFVYLSPELTLHEFSDPYASYAPQTPITAGRTLSFDNVRFDIVPDDPLKNYATSVNAEVEAINSTLSRIGGTESWEREWATVNNIGLAYNVVMGLGNFLRALKSDDRTFEKLYQDIVNNGDFNTSLNTPFTYHAFLPFLLEDSYVYLQELCEEISASDQETVVGFPGNPPLPPETPETRRLLFEGRRIRSKQPGEYQLPEQYFSFSNLLEAAGSVNIHKTHGYRHIIDGNVFLKLHRGIAYDYLTAIKGDYSVTIPIGGYYREDRGEGSGMPTRYWLSYELANYEERGGGPLHWPLSWPIGEVLQELTAFVSLLDIPSEAERQQIHNTVLRQVNQILPGIAAQYLEQNGEYPPQFYRQPITELYVDNIDPDMGLGFSVRIGNPGGLNLFLDSLKVDAPGVTDPYRWLQLTSQQYNLSDPRYWSDES
jgi:hypothetical protein